MISYDDIIFYVACFGFSLLASVFRQCAYPAVGQSWGRVAWISLYTATSAMAWAVVIVDAKMANKARALAGAMTIGLGVGELCNVIKNKFTILDKTGGDRGGGPPMPGGTGGHADAVRVDRPGPGSGPGPGPVPGSTGDG